MRPSCKGSYLLLHCLEVPLPGSEAVDLGLKFFIVVLNLVDCHSNMCNMIIDFVIGCTEGIQVLLSLLDPGVSGLAVRLASLLNALYLAHKGLEVNPVLLLRLQPRVHHVLILLHLRNDGEELLVVSLQLRDLLPAGGVGRGGPVRGRRLRPPPGVFGDGTVVSDIKAIRGCPPRPGVEGDLFGSASAEADCRGCGDTEAALEGSMTSRGGGGGESVEELALAGPVARVTSWLRSSQWGST